MFLKSCKVFLIFLRLGVTSFGGPIAHLGYFHNEFVLRRKWIDEHSYSDLVALCQFLPGPASSQVGIALGLSRSGLLGAFAAWLGFTLPSAIILILFGLGVSSFGDIRGGWLHGLKVVAVAIVAQAIWSMWVKLCPDFKRASIAIVAAIAVLTILPSAFGQIVIILTGGFFGFFFLHQITELPHSPIKTQISKTFAISILAIFCILLATLPMLSLWTGNSSLHIFSSFFRVGALVFGGGHVVLPLLQSEVVPNGLISNDVFMAGYGAAQAIPGPLFAFTAYLGAVSAKNPSGIFGAIICLVAVFLPSFLLIIGTLPFWESLRNQSGIRYAMQGINASVVGLLIAAFYHPVWTSAIFNLKDFVLALGLFLLLIFFKLPSWAVVAVAVLVGGVFFN